MNDKIFCKISKYSKETLLHNKPEIWYLKNRFICKVKDYYELENFLQKFEILFTKIKFYIYLLRSIFFFNFFLICIFIFFFSELHKIEKTMNKILKIIKYEKFNFKKRYKCFYFLKWFFNSGSYVKKKSRFFSESSFTELLVSK